MNELPTHPMNILYNNLNVQSETKTQEQIEIEELKARVEKLEKELELAILDIKMLARMTIFKGDNNG